jgi:hypothetical protein
VRGIESLIKYWAGQPREAREYALSGLEIPGVTGTVAVWLYALQGRAEAVLGNATTAEPSFGDQAGAHAALAIARIRGGDVDGAAEALTPVLSLPPAMRINGVVSCVTSVHRALSSAPEASVAAETQQAIEAFCHAPAALPR